MSLAKLLTEHRNEIVRGFLHGVQQRELAPARTSVPTLIDHIPAFLDEIGAELSRLTGPRTSLDALEVNTSARQHGQQRWHAGYDLEAVVREYGVLLQAILDVARETGSSLSVDEFALLARYVNVGAVGATAQYVHSRDDQLAARQVALEFLTEAGALLSSSLDFRSTLARLTRLLVPHLGDFCVVRLDDVPVEETPLAHVDPEKLELVRDVVHSFRSPQGALMQSGVVRSGESILVESADAALFESLAQSPAQLESLRRLSPCSWLVVPLRIKNNFFGTITLGRSESGLHYGQSDLRLAEEVARRAAAAIDNAKLYEQSGQERARAEAATRIKDEFVAMVSHELRTPLNVIIGWVRLLRSGTLPEGTAERALEVIERNANAQSQLVSDLLDVSRIITGKIHLDPAQVDLSSIVLFVVEDARLALDAKRLELDVSVPSEGAHLRGDAERLRQIAWNLLINAIKFSEKGGKVWVSVRHVESSIELRVRDNGIGIAPEFLPHVFDSFRQSDSKTTRAHGGLGIGLSIVKHLVDLHGGAIEARSAGLGEGAEFVVLFPVSAVISATIGVAKQPATAPQRQNLRRPEGLHGLSVLVVDDEEDARDLLRVVLESCDMRVLTVASVAEALDAVTGEHFDLILSDIGMPDEDGYSLIKKIRSLPDAEKAKVPAIALTAFAASEDRSRALLAGFNEHMTKPVEPAELLMALADLVRHRPSTPGG